MAEKSTMEPDQPTHTWQLVAKQYIPESDTLVVTHRMRLTDDLGWLYSIGNQIVHVPQKPT